MHEIKGPGGEKEGVRTRHFFVDAVTQTRLKPAGATRTLGAAGPPAATAAAQGCGSAGSVGRGPRYLRSVSGSQKQSQVGEEPGEKKDHWGQLPV